MADIKITTLMDEDQYKEIKSEGLTIKHIIKLGYLAWKNNPQLIKRINELEGQIQLLQSTDKRIYGRLEEIER